MKSSYKMTFQKAKRLVGKVGVSLRKVEGEYRINYRGWKEANAYYTSDLKDAVDTALGWYVK